MSYDFVVVGAGMFGATFARGAADRGKKVLVIDKLPHVGGMCHTVDREGIAVHAYGPHVFHTNDREVWAFVNRFARFDPYSIRTKAVARGKIWSFPVNLLTLYQLWGVRTPDEARRRLERERVDVRDPGNLEDWVLSTYGREIYETFFLGYTTKQWGRSPRKLPAQIAQRLPFRLTFEDSYYMDRYQGIPAEGYASFFTRMLEGVEVRTATEFDSDRETFRRLGKVVYSGRIDEFFDYRFGPLAFRTCRFETEVGDGDFQGNAIINYCDLEVPYTRIIEHKHFAARRSAKTVITREYPEECGRLEMPLYPVNDGENAERYRRYSQIPTDAAIAGRLGSYRYFDMCEVMAQAWKLLDTLCGRE